MITLILGGIFAVLLVGGYLYCKIRKANTEIDRLFKENHELQNQKAVAETQVKHFETRKKNEENSRNTDRTALLNRLQQQGDLRD